MSAPVAVITGAASGIGQALAVRYAAAGIHVVAGYFPGDAYDPQATVRAVKDAGGQCITHPVDVRNTDEVDALIDRCIDEWGRLDIAVANAGILRREPLTGLTDDAWNALLDIDLGGVLRLFRAAAAALRDSGSLIAVSSIAGGIYGWSDHAHYATAKAGIIGLVKSLALELAPRGIRANAVIPGTIDTPQARDSINSLGPQGILEQARELPLGRPGHPADIANAIAFLTSDQASYITGTTLTVDGGMSALMPR